MSSSGFEAIPFNKTTSTTNKRRAKTPSFSSILLDAIYRSIDDSGDGDGDPPTTASAAATPTNKYMKNNNYYDYTYSAASKQRRSRSKMRHDSNFETLDLRHASMIDSWMERQEQQHRQPYDQFNNVDHDDDHRKIRFVRQKSVPSRSTVTDSSSSRNFSKVRTNLASRAGQSCFAPATVKREASSRIFTKTKSRAMKIYGELKKPKPPQNPQPISPGARIAAFLNSIFRNSGDRKPTPPPPATSSTPATSTCSSASSFSRSCLSKTPKSSSSGTRSVRSVRFYPFSVIVDEDSRPSGHKSLNKDDPEGINYSNNRSESKWRREKEIDALMSMIKRNCRERERGAASSPSLNNGGDHHDDSESDDEQMINDGESCASSDLFELENFSSIGVGVGVSRYAEELPVYGTTSLHKIKC